jgi:hypothetical protein
MTQELFDALEALCSMWEQYCGGGEWGHCCMSAGENCEEVLDRYKLLIPTKGYGNDVNYERLEELRKSIEP